MPRCCPSLRTSGVGPGSMGPKLTGVETLRADGNPTVVSKGISSSSPMITACSPKALRVVQLRRSRSAQELSSKLAANMASSSVKSVWCYRHRQSQRWGDWKEKRPRNFRGLVELFAERRCPLQLLFRGLARLRSRWFGSCRRRSLRSGSWGTARCRCRSRHARLHVIGIDHVLRDVDGSHIPPEHRALRPGLRGVDDHGVSVVLCVLHDEWRHLVQDPACDLLLLVADFFLGILHVTIEDLLPAFDLLLKICRRIFVQFRTLRVELLLQGFEFIVLALELGLLGLIFFLPGIHIALAFVAVNDRLLDVDGSHPAGTRGNGSGCRGRGPRRAGQRGRRSGSTASLGEGGERECRRNCQ